MSKLLCSLVRRGLPFHHCCKIAGLSYSVFADWRANDPKFAERIDASISHAVKRRLATIERAADKGDFRAAEIWLRLCCPAEFGRQRIEISAGQTDTVAISEETLGRIAKARLEYEQEQQLEASRTVLLPDAKAEPVHNGH